MQETGPGSEWGTLQRVPGARLMPLDFTLWAKGHE